MMALKERLRLALIKLQPFTGTDNIYIARGGFWVGLGHFGSMALSFLLAVFFANIASRELYGSYKYVIAAVSVLGSLTLSGLVSAVVQAIARGNDGTIKRAMLLQLRWSWIPSLAGIITSIYYITHANNTLAIAFAAAALALPLTSTLNISGGFYAGKKLFRESSAISLLSHTLTTALVISAVVIWHSVTATVLAYLVGSVISSSLSYGYMRYKYSLNNAVDERALSFGRHLSLMGIISIAATQSDKLWMFHGAGAAPLALYAFVVAFPEQIRGAMKSLLNIGIPKFSTTPPEDLHNSILDKTFRLTTIICVVVLVYWFAAPYLYQIFFPAYIDAVAYSRIYALGLILIPGITLFSAGIFVRRHTKRMYILRLVPDLTALILASILIPQFGIWGAIMKNIITWIVMFALGALLFFYDRPSLSLSK